MNQRSRPKKTTVRDVAEAAGVSVATVSRVLNDSAQVAPDKKSRVLDAIDTLRFTPSAAARAVNTGRSRIVGALIPTLEHAIFARFLNVLEERLNQHELSLVVAATRGDPDVEVARARALANLGIEGLFVSGVTHDPAFFELVQRRDIPVLATSYFDPSNALPTVGYDNAKAARMAMDHLIELGHKDIIILHGPVANNDRTAERLKGAKSGSDISVRTFESPLDFTAVGSVLENALAVCPNATAALCFSDVLAQGALLHMPSLGLAAPSDLSVIGIDDLPGSASVPPGLTTVHLPVGQMGEHAADQLAGWVEGRGPAKPFEVKPRLIVRGSTAAPRKK